VAHHKSAIKRIRRNNSANLRNSSYMASVRTAVKKFRAAVKQGGADVGVLNPLFVSAQKIVSKAAQKGIIHKNNAARTVSRLAKLLKNAGSKPTEATAKKAPAKKATTSTAAVKKKKASKKKTVSKK